MTVNDLDISKAKIKTSKNKWQEYLADKVLIVGEIGGHYSFLGFEGQEEDYKELCRIAWYSLPKEERPYEHLGNFIDEVLLGNDGFGFDAEEIEIIERIGDAK